MIKTTYNFKQQQLAAQTAERLKKHREEIEAIELNKMKKLKKQKKEVFRARSKNEIRKEKKAHKEF